MNRRKAIKHADQVFAPVQPSSDFAKQLAMAAPLIGFMLAGYIWMVLDILNIFI
jgi:hypothetical protein